MKHATTFCLLIMFVAVGCGRNDSELARLEKLQQEMLEARSVDLSKTLSLDSAVLVGDESELQDIADSFMQKFAAGQTSAAFTEIQQYTPWPVEEFEALKEQTEQQLTMVKPRYGDLIGYEFVGAKRPSESLLTLVYLAKCENHALRCRFIFYKPKDKWFLNMFLWDDQIMMME